MSAVVSTSPTSAIRTDPPPRTGRWQTIRRFTRNRLAMLGASVIAAMILCAIAARWLAPFDPVFGVDSSAYLSAPSATHPLGTDRFGRDVLSRIIHGARISLYAAGVSVAIALVVGGTLGLLAGYFRGHTDAILSRAMDVLIAFPDILLALAIMAVLGARLINVILAIGVVYTPIFARVARAAAMQVRAAPYIEAARAVGVRHPRILLRHVLPNIAAPLIVQTTLSFAFAILAEAALSFLGLGVEPDAASWGIMLRDGKDRMEIAWWVAVFPGLAITLAVLAFNTVGDALRDALDPRLRT